MKSQSMKNQCDMPTCLLHVYMCNILPWQKKKKKNIGEAAMQAFKKRANGSAPFQMSPKFLSTSLPYWDDWVDHAVTPLPVLSEYGYSIHVQITFAVKYHAQNPGIHVHGFHDAEMKEVNQLCPPRISFQSCTYLRWMIYYKEEASLSPFHYLLSAGMDTAPQSLVAIKSEDQSCPTTQEAGTMQP